MPSRELHNLFDDYLTNRGVIYEDTDGTAIHNRLDRNVKKLGPVHREYDYYHSIPAIREWIYNLVKGLGTIRQETRTDYVRIAFGHLVIDDVVTDLKRQYNCKECDLDETLVIKSTWRVYKRYGLNQTRYKSPNRTFLERLFG